MFDYTGYECKSCKKKFEQDDDIVVCPECGTPYHRKCYLKEGNCINTELHEKKLSWKSEVQAAEEQAILNGKICRNCKNTLRDDQLFCDKCGTPTDFFLKQHESASVADGQKPYQKGSSADYSSLYGESSSVERNRQTMETIYPYMINYTDPLCGFNPDEEYEDGLTLRNLGDFVNTNTHYYLPIFKFMKNGKFQFSLNIPAMLFPEIFFANRKMPLIALLVLTLKTLIKFPATILSTQVMLEDKTMRDMFIQVYPFLTDSIEKLSEINLEVGLFGFLYNLSTVLNWVLIFVFALLSNYIYYRFVLKKASKIKEQAQGIDCSAALRQSGGTSSSLLILFIVLEFVFQYVAMGVIGFLF